MRPVLGGGDVGSRNMFHDELHFKLLIVYLHSEDSGCWKFGRFSIRLSRPVRNCGRSIRRPRKCKSKGTAKGSKDQFCE